MDISLDYLVGTADHYLKDRKMLERLQELDALADFDKEHILYTLDRLLRDAKPGKLMLLDKKNGRVTQKLNAPEIGQEGKWIFFRVDQLPTLP